MKISYEYTDTFGGDANYSWVKRGSVDMPELTHYGYDGGSSVTFYRASKIWRRELMRKVKAAIGLSGVRGTVTTYGDITEFRPYGICTVLFIGY